MTLNLSYVLISSHKSRWETCEKSWEPSCKTWLGMISWAIIINFFVTIIILFIMFEKCAQKGIHKNFLIRCLLTPLFSSSNALCLHAPTPLSSRSPSPLHWSPSSQTSRSELGMKRFWPLILNIKIWGNLLPLKSLRLPQLDNKRIAQRSREAWVCLLLRGNWSLHPVHKGPVCTLSLHLVARHGVVSNVRILKDRSQLNSWPRSKDS